MPRGLTRGMTAARLRTVLLLLFALLAIPTVALIVQTQRQLRWESYHQYGTLADELALRIDAELQRLVAAEEARAFADYGFATVGGEAGSKQLLQRSELSLATPGAGPPGAIGWFQIDADGAFSTPLLPPANDDPAAFGLPEADVAQRRALAERIRTVLAGEPAVGKDKQEAKREGAEERARSADDEVAREDASALLDALAGAASSPPSPRSLEASKLGRIDELQVDTRYQTANVEREAASASRLAEQRLKANVSSRALRKEQAAEPVFADADRQRAAEIAAEPPAQVRLFEGELDPFQFRLLDAGHGLLYRRVWRDGRRGVQGVLFDLPAFLQQVVVDPFQGSALAPVTDLVVALRGDVLRVVAAQQERGYRVTAADVEGELLHQVRLSAPFDDLQLLWTAHELPAGPGARLVGWTALVLFATLALGLYALYRLGLRQIALAGQQRDFVSAVSHELKTPLTSIRMYAEMLRAGWASEEKKREYYEFIHDESERLSRLIGNVLQLARLEREELALQPRPVAVAALLDMLRSRVQAQIERAGFAIVYAVAPESEDADVQVDPDAFVQILINLVDNALKFAAQGEPRRLELAVRGEGRTRVAFALRDHGPGVPASQLQRIFEPFQRGGNELTREAPGTGIGLALARQLARAMGGDLTYRAAVPGAEFILALPRVPPAEPGAAA